MRSEERGKRQRTQAGFLHARSTAAFEVCNEIDREPVVVFTLDPTLNKFSSKCPADTRHEEPAAIVRFASKAEAALRAVIGLRAQILGCSRQRDSTLIAGWFGRMPTKVSCSHERTLTGLDRYLNVESGA